MTIRFTADGRDGTVTRTVSTAEHAVTAARQFAADALDRWTVPDPVRSDALLMVSELVTNALIHGRRPIELRLHRGAGRLLIDVHDTAGALPRLRRPGPESADGRGLQIVAAVAGEWGARATPDGKTVWCTLDTAPR